MDELLKLVVKGAGKLFELVPLWMGAKTEEEKAAIMAKASELVNGLDAYFDSKTAQDKAAQDALQAAIDAAKENDK